MKLKMKTRFRFTLLLATFALAAIQSTAATRTWDGGGTTGNWDATANWVNNIGVANGDLAVFPSGAARLVNTNRAFGGIITNLSAIRFTGGGYTVFSSPLNLTAGLTNANTAVGGNALGALLRPLADQTWAVAARTDLTLRSNVAFPFNPITLTLDVAGSAVLEMNGSLLGSVASDVVKQGLGRLTLNGSSNVVDDFAVNGGILELNGSLESTLLIASNAVLEGTGVLPSIVTCFGELRPGGVGVGVLSFRSSSSPILQPGARLVVDINGLTPGTEFDQLRSVGTFKLTGTELVVRCNNTFPFAVGQKFVIITNGVNSLGFSTTFTNLPQNGLLTNNGVVLQISYSGGNGNDVELKVVDTPFVPTDVTRIWDGGAGTGSRGWSNVLNWENNTTRPDQGDDLVFPTSASLGFRTMTNDLATTRADFTRLWFGGGEFVPWVLHGGAFKLFAGLVATNEDGSGSGSVQLRNAGIELIGPQTWSLTNVNLQITAPIVFGSNTLRMTSAGANGALVDAGLFGPGTLLIRSGFVELLPNAAVSNVAVRVEGGVLNALDAQAFGPEWQMSDGVLAFRSARIPGLQADGGTIDFIGDGHGEIEGSLKLGPACIIEAQFVTEDDQPFIVSDNVDLSGAQLLVETADSSLAGSGTLTLINNLGTNAVNGTFNGLPEGSVVFVDHDESGVAFTCRISYVGGNGNDVTLTPLVAPRFTSVQRFANGDVLLRGRASIGATVRVESSADLVTFALIGTVAADNKGAFTFLDHAGASSERFYRTFTP